MGSILCPFCHQGSWKDLQEFKKRLESVLTCPLSCLVCSQTVLGLTELHAHLCQHQVTVQNIALQQNDSPESYNFNSVETLNFSSYSGQYIEGVSVAGFKDIPQSSDGILPFEKLDLKDKSPRSSWILPVATSSILAGNHSSINDPQTSSRSLLQENRPFLHNSSPGSTSEQFSCNECGLLFCSEHFLKWHKDIIHKHSDDFEVCCKLCESKFKDLESYRNHVRLSHNEQRYMCEQCPKLFKLKGSLVVHKRMYHDGTPSSCRFCHKKFSSDTRRDFHERRHHANGGKATIKGKFSQDGERTPSPKKVNTVSAGSLQNARRNLDNLMEKNQIHYAQVTVVNPPNCSDNASQLIPTAIISMAQDCNLQQLISYASPADKFYSNNKELPVREAIKNISVTQNTLRSSDTQPGHFKYDSQDFSKSCQNIEKCAVNKSPGNNDFFGSNCSFWPSSLSSRVSSSNQFLAVRLGSANNSNEINSSVLKTTSVTSSIKRVASVNDLADTLQVKSSLIKSPVRTASMQKWNSVPDVAASEATKITRPIPLDASYDSPASPPCGRSEIKQLTSNIDDGSQCIASHFSDNSFLPIETCFRYPASNEDDSQINFSQQSTPSQASCSMNSNEIQRNFESTNLNDKVGLPALLGFEGKQWECEVCKKCFTTKYFLKKHKRLHTGETPYSCSTCGKTFTFQQSYHKHLLYHSDEKPHVCTFCGRAFKEMSTLHNHVRIHTGEKPFVCETCGKAFRQRVSYLVHQRIHTGVLPYTCQGCNKSFRYKVSLRSHKCEEVNDGTPSPSIDHALPAPLHPSTSDETSMMEVSFERDQSFNQNEEETNRNQNGEATTTRNIFVLETCGNFSENWTSQRPGNHDVTETHELMTNSFKPTKTNQKTFERTVESSEIFTNAIKVGQVSSASGNPTLINASYVAVRDSNEVHDRKFRARSNDPNQSNLFSESLSLQGSCESASKIDIPSTKCGNAQERNLLPSSHFGSYLSAEFGNEPRKGRVGSHPSNSSSTSDWNEETRNQNLVSHCSEDPVTLTLSSPASDSDGEMDGEMFFKAFFT
ncbi:uncharacterized protein LOC108677321 isoform X2 [Hyalella azteca]|uniref:Uncharacterized protein LOC108677321 isoform X2 n=1 Tax=Hyalella azteca TaxID=294128 RepID=A0A979FH01_HYAAZ|nr:uncharacterized protein LOC108677321 isoform X2 [Hyalella azteca]